MAKERLSMRKIKEVLGLYFEHKLNITVQVFNPYKRLYGQISTINNEKGTQIILVSF